MFFYPLFFILFLSLLFVGIYLSGKYSGNRLVFWASMNILCGSMFGLQILLEKLWVPFVLSQKVSPVIFDISMIVTAFLNTGINTFPYIGILIFFLIYNGYFTQQRWILFLIFIPMWLTFLQTDYIQNHVNLDFVIVWGVCYLFLIIGLVIRAIWKEVDHQQRVRHVLIGIIFIFPLITLCMYQYVNSSVSDQLITIIPYVCVGSLLLITSMYVRDAFVGVKRRSVQTVHVGTGLIQHSLKNSINKIKLNALNLRKNVQMGNYEELEASVDTLLRIHEEMNRTMSQISRSVNDKLKLTKTETDLASILDEVLEFLTEYPDVQVIKEYSSMKLSLDRELVTECIQNICNNAVEAMNESGVLHISVETRRNGLRLIIRDTGMGMTSIQLNNVFEPFYSTKYRTGRHFGLGMYQVKKVMEAHKGKVEILSVLNEGTTIVLNFK